MLIPQRENPPSDKPLHKTPFLKIYGMTMTAVIGDESNDESTIVACTTKHNSTKSQTLFFSFLKTHK